MIPANRFDPVTMKMVNAYPLPQTTALTNNYTTNLNQQQNWDQGDIRVDHQITLERSILRALFDPAHGHHRSAHVIRRHHSGHFASGAAGRRGFLRGHLVQPVQHAVAAYTHIFSPALINDLRVGLQPLSGRLYAGRHDTD